MRYTILLIFVIMTTQCRTASEADPFLWLEDIDSSKSLEWVEKFNERSLSEITAHSDFQNLYNKNLEILNSTDRIPAPTIHGDYIYNFWQDRQYVRGIWRRSLRESYLSGSPEWELLLDIDKLSEKEGKKWVFKRAVGLFPDYERFLVYLSPGGGDAVVIREFDVTTLSFIDDGFIISEAKGDANWIDKNTLLVSTDFGDGVTTSGYPIQVKIWKRGTPISDATELYRGSNEDMGVWGYVMRDGDDIHTVITRRTSFYTGEYHFLENDKLVKIDLPDDIELKAIFGGKVLFQLKSPLKIDDDNFLRGDVISCSYQNLISNKKEYELVFRPTDKESVTEISKTDEYLVFNILSNVKSRLFSITYRDGWIKDDIDFSAQGSINLGSADLKSNSFFFYYQNFLEPLSLYYADSETKDHDKIYSLPQWFSSEKFQVNQFEAVSADGTHIPYFVVHSKTMKYDGNNPLLLYAYGGFEVSMLPSYSAIIGSSWLEKGGVYVLANLRGGGEFGPEWHQAGLKANRQRIYEDFYAVAEDLFNKKITSSEKLGIYGGSNGGLLVGVAFTQNPDYYKAVVCAVPLLDMQRYNKLLAGASWMAEYGNPDIPEEWEYIKKYSPYHNLKTGVKYPEVLFTTSTRDDRVHPGHARKMAAKMDQDGYKIYYLENTEGGHAGSSTNEQRATINAAIYTYLQMKLID